MQSLDDSLKTLHLPAARACYAEVAERAAKEGWGYTQFLEEVLARECEVRRQHRVERLLHESRLPLQKSLESFELARLPLRIRQQLSSLLDGRFLERRENVLVFGNPGSGKTHLLCAISQALIRKGYRVLHRSCCVLVQELLLAKRDLALPRTLKRLGGYDALLIDDLGYVQQSREEMEVLFTLLADRYERGSVLLTSNLPFSRWEEIFKDPMTTAAAIDRLVHHSVIIELNLSSYRMEEARAAKATAQRPAAALPEQPRLQGQEGLAPPAG